VSNDRIIYEWWVGEDSEWSGRGLVQALSGHLVRRAKENHENPVRMANVLAEIRTKHLLNTSL
jgi:hypothetical protein